jgi:cytochrome P450
MSVEVPHNPQQLYSWYHDMRRSHPIWYSEQDRSWHVFRYADVYHVMMHPQIYSSEIPLPEGQPRILTLMDDPRHRHLRRLIAQAFTPRRIAALEGPIASLVHHLLRHVLPTGLMDVIADLADPLSILVIAELLGIPAQDRTQFRVWARDIAQAAPLDAVSRGRDLHEYFRAIIEERRSAPQNDLISALLAATLNERSLTEDELLGVCQVLLVAGSETVVYLIGNAMLCFDEYPGTWQTLRKSPHLLPGAIEEVLRYYAPQSRSIRIAKEDTSLGETRIREGEYITIWLASANRDEEQFPLADHFLLDRFPQPACADHLSLGTGSHVCLGASLGRLEARIALGMLIECLAEIQLVSTHLEMASGLVYGPKQLPITFTGQVFNRNIVANSKVSFDGQ